MNISTYFEWLILIFFYNQIGYQKYGQNLNYLYLNKEIDFTDLYSFKSLL